MMGPDPDGGNAAGFAREDFTLLNLSRSSSSLSSSDELFAHHQHPLPPNNPNKKKRLRLKRRSGYSVRQNRATHDSSQTRTRGSSPFGLGSPNMIYALLLLLLSWSATLSWLTFSLRNQLTTTSSNLATFETVTKDLPVELTKMNQTIQILQANITTLGTRIDSLQNLTNAYEKNLTDSNGLVRDLSKTIGQIGSKQKELVAIVDELQKKEKDKIKRSSAKKHTS